MSRVGMTISPAKLRQLDKGSGLEEHGAEPHASVSEMASTVPSETSQEGIAASEELAALPECIDFAVTVVNVAGERTLLTGLTPDVQLSDLNASVMNAFCSSAGVRLHQLHDIGHLYNGLRVLDDPARTLREYGLRKGPILLTFVQTKKLLLLKASEGMILQVAKEVACMSKHINDVVDTHGAEMEILLPDVKLAILKKVMQYCAYHVDNIAEPITKPLPSTNLRECNVREWDSDFVEIEQGVLFEIILAANHLDVQALLDLCCAKVASMIKGKTTEEIRQQFNIVNDFTPEEEAQVREENRWCEDA